VRTMIEQLSDRMLSRFVPKLQALAACCGSCCDTHVERCHYGWKQKLVVCYAERFEGCFSYYSWYRDMGTTC
jgi:hypothetical protein